MTEAPIDSADETTTETIADPAGESVAKRPGSSLIRSSALNSSLTLVSRFMGFVRDLAISYRMGASATPAADAFYTALMFPNLFRRIFGEGAFAAAFQPAYVRALEQQGKEAADKLAEEAMAGLALITVLLTVACQLAMPWLMLVISKGYISDPAKFRLAVMLTQITMPYLPCMAIYAHLSGVLNSHGRFIVSGLAPVLLNVIMLLFVFPQHDPVLASVWASAGVTAAGVAQVGLLWWGVRKSGSHVRWVWPTLNPEIRALIAKAVPGALSASAFQVNIFISGILASQIAGARSWLNAADRLYQLPVGLVGVAIGVALLPRLSRAVHTGDEADARGAMDEAITFAMAFTLPAAAAMLAMPFFMIDGLFTRGAFLAYDARSTGAVLFQYGWGAPAFVLMQIVNRAFYARQDTKTPMRVALVQVAVNVGLGLALFHWIGAPGIAAATSAASWLSVVQMIVILHSRDHYVVSPRAVSRLLRVLAASALLGVILAFGSRWLQAHASPRLHFGPIHYKELALAVTAGLALPLYGLLLFASGGVTPAELKGALRRRR
ncbi:MAG TPA: murein biosynthesis integral membrane protein MurJ [Caulobacteraceae bacterium]